MCSRAGLRGMWRSSGPAALQGSRMNVHHWRSGGVTLVVAIVAVAVATAWVRSEGADPDWDPVRGPQSNVALSTGANLRSDGVADLWWNATQYETANSVLPGELVIDGLICRSGPPRYVSPLAPGIFSGRNRYESMPGAYCLWQRNRR